MPTVVRRKSGRVRSVRRKTGTTGRMRAKRPQFVLSDAEIARIKGGQESFASLP